MKSAVSNPSAQGVAEGNTYSPQGSPPKTADSLFTSSETKRLPTGVMNILPFSALTVSRTQSDASTVETMRRLPSFCRKCVQKRESCTSRGSTFPFSSIARHLSPSPSNASPKSHLLFFTAFAVSESVEGLGSKFRVNFPGVSQLNCTISQPASERRAGASEYAAALPASMRTRGCFALMEDASAFEMRNEIYSFE